MYIGTFEWLAKVGRIELIVVTTKGSLELELFLQLATNYAPSSVNK